MAASGGVKVTLDRLPDFQKVVEELASSHVMVGIPSDEEQPKFGAAGGTEKRDDVPIGNALIGYLQETGVPSRNVPARPHLAPGVDAVRERVADYLQQAGEAALDGDRSRVERGLHAAGLTAVDGVKTRIQSKIPPPLAPGTVAARRRRYASRGGAAASASDDFTPLIDTAQYINAIGYVIRRGQK